MDQDLPLTCERLYILRVSVRERTTLAKSLSDRFTTCRGFFDTVSCAHTLATLFFLDAEGLEPTITESCVRSKSSYFGLCLVISTLLGIDVSYACPPAGDISHRASCPDIASSSSRASGQTDSRPSSSRASCPVNSTLLGINVSDACPPAGSSSPSLGQIGAGNPEMQPLDPCLISAVSCPEIGSSSSKTSTFEWRSATMAVRDLVVLAPGVRCSKVLRPGEIGQILRDNRSGSNPFQVRGPRGHTAWFRCESLLPYGQESTNLVCSRGHLLMRYFGRFLEALGPACCRRCGNCLLLDQPRWRCDLAKECSEYSVCDSCVNACERTSQVTATEEVPLEPLIQQVVRVLNPDVHLDFPSLTDICEAAARSPGNADLALAVLAATLGEQELKPGDTRNVTQDYLKVLTIFNEMVYDDQVTEVLRHTPGLQLALDRLRRFRTGEFGSETDENIRMLATEVEKAVFQVFNGGGLRAGAPMSRMEISAKCRSGHPLEWKGGQSIFHIHKRCCAACRREISKDMERYTCRVCVHYDVCAACFRRGAS